MSFIGAIDSVASQKVWSQAIMSIAAISDQIKFVITDTSLSVSAINNANTSHGEIEFSQKFFHEFSMDFSDILPEGYDKGDGKTTQSYSFLLNSKHLSTLFKNLENDLSYICLRVYCNKFASIAQKYKLFVEIKTKKLIIKKFQTNYQPILISKLDIPNDYKQEFYNQPSEYFNSGNKVNYLMLDQSIPKNFLDMVPSSTEDFKIEFKGEKLSFAGYTKQVVKDKEYLKQPMAVSIAMSLHDTFSSNLLPSPKSTQSSDPPKKQSINFRIKEFRNFINLCNSVDCDTPFEIYFKNPGDPILFEFSHQNILIQYIQITADDDKSSPHGNSSTLGSTILSLDELTSRKLSLKLQKHQSSEKRAKPDKALADPKVQTQTPRSVRGSRSETPVNNPTPSSEAGDEFVTYGRERTPQEEDHPNKKQKTSDFSILPSSKINDPDTEYSDSSEDIDEAMLGPTQMNNKPKSIFD